VSDLIFLGEFSLLVSITLVFRKEVLKRFTNKCVVFSHINSLIIGGCGVSHSRLMTGRSVAYAACVRKQVQPTLSSHV